MSIKLLVAISCAACTTGPPLTRVTPQIEIQSDPAAGTFTLSMTTWNDLDVLHDGIASGEIQATLDARPLVIDAASTGYFGQRDSYAAVFEPPETDAAISHGATSQIAITDGVTTWSAAIANLFANDLAATGSISGQTTFVWPSAASPAPYSLIDWACIAVAGQASECTPAISQQFVTATLVGAPGTHVIVTAERSANTQMAGDGPELFVHVDNRLDAMLGP